MKRKVHRLGQLPPPRAVTAATEATEGFHAIVIPEGTWSRDGRWFENLHIDETRPNAQVLMGLLENTMFHEKAVNIGHFTRWEKRAGVWHGWGEWANTDEAWDVREAVRGEHVTSVSVEVADADVQYLIPAEMLTDMEAVDDFAEGDEAGDEPETETIDGEEYLVVDIPQDRMRIMGGEITGASVVPTGAYGEGTIEDLRPDEQRPTAEAIAAAVAPVKPPREWFAAPTAIAAERGGTFDVEIDDETGRIFGYPAASWATEHATMPGVTPPRSTTNYANFARRHVRCDDGSKVRVGPLTLRGGHADKTWTAARAMAHYDDTDSAFADVAVGEDEYGMWVAGALRPTITPEAVRTAMCSGFSGDWRMIGGDYDLIAISAVNAEAFRNHVSIYEDELGMVASMIVDMRSQAAIDADALTASAAERIAKSIGRGTDDRIKALYERVHA